jgi:hypothetical protein
MNGLPDCMLRRSFHRPGDLNRLLAGAGFGAVREQVERVEFTFQDKEDCWQSRWTHGSRVPLEQMTPDQLEGYRRDALGHLRGLKAEGGLTQRVQLFFGLGAKPAGAR